MTTLYDLDKLEKDRDNWKKMSLTLAEIVELVTPYVNDKEMQEDLKKVFSDVKKKEKSK